MKMLRKNYNATSVIFFLRFFFIILLAGTANAQIYKHNFGTTTITAHPYTVAPTTLATNLSGSSWSNSTNSWTSNAGATGQAITLITGPGTQTVTLTFNVANSFQATITSFNFWRQRSNSGPLNWAMAINGIPVGAGTSPTTGAPTGDINVSTPVTGLTGIVTVTLTLTGATGGNLRIDDFTLNGSVTSNCNSGIITAFAPATGPLNTKVTITGSRFTGTSAVNFNNVPAASFTVISDSEIQAITPSGGITGIISVIAPDGCVGQSTGTFTPLTSECTNTSLTDIFISELYDQKAGSGGVIELYNPTNSPINLNGYTLQRYGDVDDTTPSAGYITPLSGTIAARSTYLIAGTSPDQAICITPATQGSIINGFNGNDKFDLLKNGSLIDIVRVPYVEPGYTLIRKPDAIAPSATYNQNDWNNTLHSRVNGENLPAYCADLGRHTVPTVTPPTISQPASATICNNTGTTFTVAVTPSAGYTYQWKTLNTAGAWVNVTNNVTFSGSATNTLTVSQAPTTLDGSQYYCQITSASCNLKSNAAQLYVLTPPVAPVATVTPATCTVPSGTLTITAPVGTGLTYSIDGTTYQASPVFATLVPGNYSITVKNTAGCVSPATVKTIDPVAAAPAAPTVTTVQPTCTVATGSLTVTAPTGTGFTYSIDGINYQTGTSFTLLTPGNYSVTVKNAAGCASPATPKTIDPAPALPSAPVVDTVQPTCTANTGTLTITSPLGTGLTYSIDGINYQANTAFTTIAPGNYNITVKNAAGCISPATAKTVNAAPASPAVATVALTQPTCTLSTGTITISSPTGNGLTYSIDGTTYQSGLVFSGLAAGNYSITVKNAAGCISAPLSRTIDAAPASPAAPVATEVQPTCTVPTGTITITSPTGTGLTYSKDGTTYQANPVFTGVVSGTYNITVKNASGCISPATLVTIAPAPASPVAANASLIQPTCTTATGSITIISPTGTGLTYSIDGTTYQSGLTFSGLASGNYNITVKNAAGCISAPVSRTIDNAPVTPSAPTLTPVQPTCTAITGTLTVSAPTGTGFTYSKDGTTFQASPVFTGLAPGTYNITARSAAGCLSTGTQATIDPVPAAPVAPTATPIQPTCTTPTGTITVTAPSGTGFTYSIDGINYSANTIFAGLTSRTYNVTVKNAEGCTSSATPVTLSPVALQSAPAVTAIQPSCVTPTGTITVTAPTGTGFTYSIDGTNYQAGTSFSGLAIGNYNITVKDVAGCISLPANRTINAVTPLPAPVVAVTAPTCAIPSGTLTVTSPTGTGFTYSIDGTNYQASPVFAGLAPGNYNIIAKDAAGCPSLPAARTIGPVPTPPVAPTTASAPLPCGAVRGSITISSPTGTGITYSIDGTNYQTGTVFTSVLPGTYNVTVRSGGCVSAPTIQIVAPAPAIPVAPTVTSLPLQCGEVTGTITITAPTGNGETYSIDGSNYQAAAVFANLSPRTYRITVKSAAGCISPATAHTISAAPASPTVPTTSVIQPTCATATGTITVTLPTGPGLQYSIDGTTFQNSRIFTDVASGDYTITVKNAAGCESVSVGVTTIDNPPAAAPNPGIITGNTQVCVGATLQLANTVTGGVWSTSNTAVATIDADGLLTSLKDGLVTVSYTVGTICTDAARQVITIHALPAPILNDTYLCQDIKAGTMGTTTLNTGLSITTHSFEWKKDGAALNVPTGFITITAPGTYTVTATNLATGCTGMATSVVGVSSEPIATAVVGSDFSFRQTITVNITAGSGDYVYSLDGGDFQTSPYFGNIYDGEHTIRVKDINGCGDEVILKVYALNYPRFFSPNGDGSHEIWNIDGLTLQKDAKIYVYDRYGKVITTLRPGIGGWDGTYNGTKLPATDYWFKLHYTSSDGVEKEFNAHFSLLR